MRSKLLPFNLGATGTGSNSNATECFTRVNSPFGCRVASTVQATHLSWFFKCAPSVSAAELVWRGVCSGEVGAAVAA